MAEFGGINLSEITLTAVRSAVQQFLRALADAYHVFLQFRHVLKGLAMVFYGCKLGNIYGSFGYSIRQGQAAKMANYFLLPCINSYRVCLANQLLTHT